MEHWSSSRLTNDRAFCRDAFNTAVIANDDSLAAMAFAYRTSQIAIHPEICRHNRYLRDPGLGPYDTWCFPKQCNRSSSYAREPLAATVDIRA
jgi:hypothetical protein